MKDPLARRVTEATGATEVFPEKGRRDPPAHRDPPDKSVRLESEKQVGFVNFESSFQLQTLNDEM